MKLYDQFTRFNLLYKNFNLLYELLVNKVEVEAFRLQSQHNPLEII